MKRPPVGSPPEGSGLLRMLAARPQMLAGVRYLAVSAPLGPLAVLGMRALGFPNLLLGGSSS